MSSTVTTEAIRKTVLVEWVPVKCGDGTGTEVEVRFSPEGPGTRVER